jgi:hypothetical protein
MNNELKQLFERWKNAFNQQSVIDKYRSQVVTTRYADGWRYDLKNFEQTNFPAGGLLQESKEGITAITPYEYGFNQAGLPCYVSFQHQYNHMHWEGFYTYGQDLVEYVEFCVRENVPSAVQQLTYVDGKKVAWRSFRLNGGCPSNTSNGRIMEELQKNPNSFIATINNYHYDDNGRLVSASGIENMPGPGQYDISDQYTYDENGVLDSIRRSYSSFPSQLIYCRIPEGTSAESLMDALAEAMAHAIVETLVNDKVEQPMALLSLSYQYGGNCLPLLCYTSGPALAKQLTPPVDKYDQLVFHNMDYIDLKLEHASFERLFAQFQVLMEQHDDSEMGTALLSKVASLLNVNKLYGKIDVTNDFGAYAVDWSIEGHAYDEVIAVFKNCGIATNTLETWKQRGMFVFWPDAV